MRPIGPADADVRDMFRATVRGPVDADVRDMFRATVRAPVDADVRDMVRAAVWVLPMPMCATCFGRTTASALSTRHPCTAPDGRAPITSYLPRRDA